MNFSQYSPFDNIPDADCRRMMSCFQTAFFSLNTDQELDIRRYFQNDIGIVLSGAVEISRIDFSGRKSILEIIEKTKCSAACIPTHPRRVKLFQPNVSKRPASLSFPMNTFSSSAEMRAAATVPSSPICWN